MLVTITNGKLTCISGLKRLHYESLDTVNPRISARSAYFKFRTRQRALIRGGRLFEGGAYFKFWQIGGHLFEGGTYSRGDANSRIYSRCAAGLTYNH